MTVSQGGRSTKSEDEFTRRLMGFGLTKKEAECYFYLLKYGPKTPSPLAKALHTYREDMHRTLNSLIETGMVRPSLDSPTMYTAVELETALESALKKHDCELREMELRKRELEKLAQQQQFRPSEEVGTFKMLKTIKEIASAAIPIILNTSEEFVWVAPEEGLQFASLFGINSVVQELTERGGHTRGITDITFRAIPLVQEVIDTGVEARHLEGYRGLFYGVFDRKYCIQAINVDVKHMRLDEPATMLYVDDPAYATYLVNTFELLWQQSMPAEERIGQLLKQAPPQVDLKQQSTALSHIHDVSGTRSL
ncbi:MAG: TrmB family transcriptional regulator [Halobacteriota archaeon]